MSTPVPRDHRAPKDDARTSTGRGSDMAPVFRASRWRRRAACTCGWTGARRFLRGSAVVDALVHAADSGHEPAWPLVVDTVSVQDLHHDSAALRLPRLHLRGLHPR
jgi:hypothetical protein